MSAGRTILAACLLALACRTAGAEEWFRYRIEPPTVDMFLSGELGSSESKRGAAVSKVDTTTTREKLDIRTADGWIYHPALLTFSAGLQPEFEQHGTQYDGGGKQESVGTFLGFNIDASVLPYKPYTLDLHASQDKSEYRSTLARNQTTESSTYRAKLLLKEYWLPTTFTLESRDRTSESFYTTRDGTDLAKLESRHRSESSDTRLEAEFQDRSRESGSSETTSQHTLLQARNRYQPGENSRLNSSFRHKIDSLIDSDSAQTSLNSFLTVKHHEKLSSNYGLTLDNSSQGNSNSSSGTATAALQHQLYENLTTSLNGSAGKSESASGSMDNYGAGLNFAYTRAIPWGKINASLGHTEQIRDWRQVLAVAQVRDESPKLVFDNWDLVELAELDIDITTIKIFDLNNPLHEYFICPRSPSCDYSANEIGRNVQLQWVGAGTASPIVVEYSHTTDPSAKTRRITDTFGIGVNLWSMLGLNYKQDKTRADLLSGTPGTGDTQDRFSQSLSASLNLGWRNVRSVTSAGITKTELAAEEMEGGRGAAMQENLTLGQTFRVGNWSSTSFEMTDMSMSGDRSASSRSPTRTQRARQIFSFRPARHMSVSLGASYSGMEYKETGDRTKSSDYDAALSWLLGAGSLSARAYRRELQGITEETGSTGLEADYQWRYGLWEPSIRCSLVEEERQPLNTTQENSKRTKYVLYFELKREFR